jgi:hypothetical protein
MAQPFGRAARIVPDLVVVGVGFFGLGGTLGWIVTVPGLAPLLAGSFNACLVEPLIRVPFSGKDCLGAA